MTTLRSKTPFPNYLYQFGDLCGGENHETGKPELVPRSRSIRYGVTGKLLFSWRNPASQIPIPSPSFCDPEPAVMDTIGRRAFAADSNRAGTNLRRRPLAANPQFLLDPNRLRRAATTGASSADGRVRNGKVQKCGVQRLLQFLAADLQCRQERRDHALEKCAWTYSGAGGAEPLAIFGD